MNATDIPADKAASLSQSLQVLLNPSKLTDHVECAAPLQMPAGATGPKTALLYVRFSEDTPQVEAFAESLWGQCMYYALPRKRRLKFEEALKSDLTAVARIHSSARRVFIDFTKQ